VDCNNLLGANCITAAKRYLKNHWDMVSRRNIGTHFGTKYIPPDPNEFSDLIRKYKLSGKGMGCIKYLLRSLKLAHKESLATPEWNKIFGHVIWASGLTLAKGLAEAEAKRKIAEAFEQYGQAAMLDMVIEMLPEYAKQIATPLSNIDKITIVDTGSGEGGGANKVTTYATDLMATLQETLKATSGIDMKEMLENYSGKGNIRPSIDQLTNEVKAAKANEQEATQLEIEDTGN